MIIGRTTQHGKPGVLYEVQENDLPDLLEVLLPDGGQFLVERRGRKVYVRHGMSGEWPWS
jgi:hypothetical protein